MNDATPGALGMVVGGGGGGGGRELGGSAMPKS